MAQDHGLCRKKKSKMDRCTGRHCRPVLQLPTGQFCSLQTAGPNTSNDPGAHGRNRWKANKANEWGQSKLNGGKNVEKGSGHGRQSWQQANKKPAEQALQANTASGFSARHRPQNKRPQLDGLAAKTQQLTTMLAGLSPCSAGKWGDTVVLAVKKAGSDLPTVPTPPIAFACHCPYPLP